MKDDDTLREDVTRLEKIALYARELDLFTSNVRRSSGFVPIALDWIQSLRMKENRIAKNQDIEAITFSSNGKIGLSGARRRALKRERLTFDQIDEALEKAERVALDRRAERRKQIIESNSNSKQNGLTIHVTLQLFLAIETLGKIVRNSEFDDLDDKIAGIEFYIEFCQEIVMTLISLFEEVVQLILEDKVEFPKEVKEEDLTAITNVLRMAIPLTMSNQISDQLGTEKLVPVLEGLLTQRSKSFGKQFFICCLLFDLRAPGSIEKLFDLAAKNESIYRRHLIHEKLCRNYDIHRFRDADRNTLENAIAEIEILLGMNRSAKGAKISMRQSKLSDLTQ